MFKVGDIIQNFKRETLSEEELKTNRYLYQIIGIATNSDGSNKSALCRDLSSDSLVVESITENLLSLEIDHNAYPDIKQKYVYEIVD